MNKIWYSRQWDNAPMPHAVFFTKDGHAIHGTLDLKRLGKPASHGCVRLSPENAATLFALVEKTGMKNTQVVLAGSTPGGEGKVASKTRAKSSYRRGLVRSTKITTRTPFLSGENEADFLGVYLADERRGVCGLAASKSFTLFRQDIRGALRKPGAGPHLDDHEDAFPFGRPHWRCPEGLEANPCACRATKR